MKKKSAIKYLSKTERVVAMELLSVIISLQESRDFYTKLHQEKVARVSSIIAESLGMDGLGIFKVHACALVHDVGKITIPSAILNKTAELSKEEINLLKTHTSNPCLNQFESLSHKIPFYQAITQHHERINGSGYPKGLTEDEMCLEAKIIAVADVYDAMSTDRPYRKTLGRESAYEYIVTNKGILFDKEVVESFQNAYSHSI